MQVGIGEAGGTGGREGGHLEAEEILKTRPHERPGAGVPVLFLRPDELCGT